MISPILQPALNLLTQHQNEFVSFVLTLTGALILFLFRARVRLTWGRANNNFFRLPPLAPNPNGAALYSEKHYVQNTGRVPARNVDIIFSSKPDSISIWQTRQFNETQMPNGNFLLTIPDIAPKELVIIDSLWIIPNKGEVFGVRSADGVAKRVNFWVLRNFGTVFNIVSALLTLLGIYYAIVIFLHILFG